jgi:hypothetical protein
MRRLLLVLCGICLLSGGASAGPRPRPTRVYALSIGNNAPPPATAAPPLAALQYADDDAAAFDALAATVAVDAILLTVLDRRSQERFPASMRKSEPPTRAAVLRSVQALARRIEQDRARGWDSEVLLFFSGHGLDPSSAQPGLVLLDGLIDQRFLYEQILSQLPARLIHVIVDACHAEAVVRPRDATSEQVATSVAISAEQGHAWLATNSLHRFPQVGAIIATATSQQTHEWSQYEHGVFSHIVLSGLRGAADVNRDQRVEYSELHAFLGAAVSGVQDPRARAHALVRAPDRDAHATIVDLRRAQRVAWLGGIDSSLGHVFGEDAHGHRLFDAHVEPGHELRVAIPADTRIFVQAGERELEVLVQEGGERRLARAAFGTSSRRPRGSISASYHAGLFARPYGPRYYAGFVDNAGSLPVSFSAPAPHLLSDPAPARRRVLAVHLLWAGAAVSGASAVVSGILALDARNDYHSTENERPAADARSRYDRARIGFYASGAASLVFVAGAAWMSLGRDPSPRRTTAARLSPFPGRGALLQWFARW